MFENTINYRPEYILNEDGKRERFKVNRQGEYLLKDGGVYNPKDGFRLIPSDSLIPDAKGDYFRQWRPEIKNTNDIWQQIVNVTHLPGKDAAMAKKLIFQHQWGEEALREYQDHVISMV